MLAEFFDNNFIYIYYFYGLSFYSMGLALLLETRRNSELPLAKSIHLLSAFGMLHGIHEFLEMFALVDEQLHTMVFDILRILLLAVSFLALLVFGLHMLRDDEDD